MGNGAACFEFMFPLAIVFALLIAFLRRTSRQGQASGPFGRGRGRRGHSRFERRWTYIYGAKTPKGERIVGRVSALSQDEAQTQIKNRQEEPLWVRPIGDSDAVADDDAQNTSWKCQNDKCKTLNAPHARFCKTCGTPRLRESE